MRDYKALLKLTVDRAAEFDAYVRQVKEAHAELEGTLWTRLGCGQVDRLTLDELVFDKATRYHRSAAKLHLKPLARTALVVAVAIRYHQEPDGSLSAELGPEPAPRIPLNGEPGYAQFADALGDAFAQVIETSYARG
jgi:hypothetical protein